MLRRLVLPLLALCLGASALSGWGVTAVSGATYTATSSQGVTVGAANDWTPPTTTLAAVASPASGTVTLTASAADDRGTVASVSVQRAPAAMPIASGLSRFTTRSPAGSMVSTKAAKAARTSGRPAKMSA